MPSGRLSKALSTASFRVAAFFAILLIGSVHVLAGATFLTVHAVFDQHRAERIQAEVAVLSAEYRDKGLQELIDEIDERMESSTSRGTSYALVGSDGKTLAGGMPVAPSAPGWSDVPSSGDDGDGGTTRALLVELPGGVRLTVGEDLAPVSEIDAAIRGMLVWLAIASIVVGLGGGILASTAFLRRVDTIAAAAEAIAAGNMAQRIPLRGNGDDFDRLAGVLNRMLDRIGQLMENLRQVSNDIAHDLRTPLTHLRNRLDTALRDNHGNAAASAVLCSAIADADAILETFSALLRIAQIESGSRRAAFAEINLSKVFETVADAFDDAAEEGKRLRREIKPGVAIRGDRELLTQMVANLVDNAIRHTPSGATVTVRLSRGVGGVTGEVADTGPGVPEAERALIFRRFYRLDRSRTTEGTGLGLALVAAIADLHGFAVVAEDNAPGLRMRFTIAA